MSDIEGYGQIILIFIHRFSSHSLLHNKQGIQDFWDPIQTLRMSCLSELYTNFIHFSQVQTHVLVYLYYLRRWLVRPECHSGSPALCWVDVIFANLDSFVQTLLSNDVPNLECLPETLRIGKHRQQLLVASQLPRTSSSTLATYIQQLSYL